MAIRAHDITFRYGETTVLDRVSLHVPEGLFSVLLGRNGSGKSTLLKLIGGLLPFTHGNVSILGKDLTSLSTGRKAKLIGYLPQFHNPVFPFTVEEVVLTGRAAYVLSVPGERDREKADQAIYQAGIEALRKRPYTELSGGEQQLVMIARVLAQEPRVILLDEPLAHLDLPNQTNFFRLIKRLTASGMTVLAVLHDPSLAFLHGDNFVFLKSGRVRAVDGDKSPWDASILSDVYGTPIEMLPFRERALVVPL